jgi:hypothetical protein
MDFSKYKNDLPYPSNDDRLKFYNERKAKIDEMLMTRKQYDAAIAQADADADAHYQQLVDAYRKRDRELTLQFWRDAEQELGIAHLPEAVLEPGRALAWDYGHSSEFWDYGHSSGLSEVYDFYSDLAPVVLLAYEEGQRSK